VDAERRFPAVPHEIADRLSRVRAGEVLPEERELATGPVEVLEERLKPLGRLSDKTPFFDLAA
jgi:hypothetical protein